MARNDRYEGMRVTIKSGDSMQLAMYRFEAEALSLPIEYSAEWPRWAQRNNLLNPFQTATPSAVQQTYQPDGANQWVPVAELGPVPPGAYVTLRSSLQPPGLDLGTYEIGPATQVSAVPPGQHGGVRVEHGAGAITARFLNPQDSAVASILAQVYRVPFPLRTLQVPFPERRAGELLRSGELPLRGLL